MSTCPACRGPIAAVPDRDGVMRVASTAHAAEATLRELRAWLEAEIAPLNRARIEQRLAIEAAGRYHALRAVLAQIGGSGK